MPEQQPEHRRYRERTARICLAAFTVGSLALAAWRFGRGEQDATIFHLAAALAFGLVFHHPQLVLVSRIRDMDVSGFDNLDHAMLWTAVGLGLWAILPL